MARKALIVGINAYPTAPLKGCVNDAQTAHAVLTRQFNFKGDDVRMLVDARATTAAIKHRLNWLVDGARPGDTLVFHFSGHGSQIRDRGVKDELADYKDEIICPFDLDWGHKIITDDDLAAILRRVPEGANCYVILDCCHSGTGTRELRPPTENPGHTTLSRFLEPPPDIAARSTTVTTMPTRKLGGCCTPNGSRAFVKNIKSRFFLIAWFRRLFGLDDAPAVPKASPEMNHILISGCRSDQTSADAFLNGKYQGALTHSLYNKAITENPDKTLAEIHAITKANISVGGFSQESQLEGLPRLLDQRIFL